MIKNLWLWLTTPIKRRVLEWAFKEASKKGLTCVCIKNIAGTNYIVGADGRYYRIGRKVESK